MKKKDLVKDINDSVELKNSYNFKLKELEKKFNYYMNELTEDCLNDSKIYEANLLQTNNIKKISKIKKSIKQIRLKMIKKQKNIEIKYFREIHEINLNYITEDEKIRIISRENTSKKDDNYYMVARILKCDLEFKNNVSDTKKKYRGIIKRL